MAKLTDGEISELSGSAPEWDVIEEDGMKRLHRVLEFGNFAEALAFTNQVGALAEEADHHPRLVTEWGRVAITFWSHQYGGVVAEDFQMAARVDAL